MISHKKVRDSKVVGSCNIPGKFLCRSVLVGHPMLGTSSRLNRIIYRLKARGMKEKAFIVKDINSNMMLKYRIFLKKGAIIITKA